MKYVWIVSTKLSGGCPVIEGVFNSFELASLAAHSLVKTFDDDVWEKQSFRAGEEETISFYQTNNLTHKDELFAEVLVRYYPVWH